MLGNLSSTKILSASCLISIQFSQKLKEKYFLAYWTGIYTDFTSAGKTGLASPHARQVTYRLGDMKFRFTMSYNCYVIHHFYATMKVVMSAVVNRLANIVYMQKKLLSCVRVLYGNLSLRYLPICCDSASLVSAQSAGTLGNLPTGTETLDRNYCLNGNELGNKTRHQTSVHWALIQSHMQRLSWSSLALDD